MTARRKFYIVDEMFDPPDKIPRLRAWHVYLSSKGQVVHVFGWWVIHNLLGFYSIKLIIFHLICKKPITNTTTRLIRREIWHGNIMKTNNCTMYVLRLAWPCRRSSIEGGSLWLCMEAHLCHFEFSFCRLFTSLKLLAEMTTSVTLSPFRLAN